MSDDTALVSAEQQAIGQLLNVAIEKGIDAESLQRIVAMAEHAADRDADKQLSGALNLFQNDCPTIGKNQTAKIKTKQGGSYSYTFASLDHIAKTIAPLLHKHGLAYSWDSSVTNGELTCTCTLRHTAGAKVSSSFSCPTSSASAMSDQQKAASALSFAKRQSLTSVLGLTTCDDDNDAADDGATFDKINEAQEQEILNAMEELGIDYEKFCAFLGVKALPQVTTNRMPEVNNALAAKRRARATE